jgi:hypothetical protein
LAERARREELEAAAEAARQETKRLSAAISRNERERKAKLAAEEAAKKKAANDEIIAMKNEIKALSSDPIASNAAVPMTKVDTSTSDNAARVARKAEEMKKTMQNYEKEKAKAKESHEGIKEKTQAGQVQEDDGGNYYDDFGDDDYDDDFESPKALAIPKSPKKDSRQVSKSKKSSPASVEESNGGYSDFDDDFEGEGSMMSSSAKSPKNKNISNSPKSSPSSKSPNAAKANFSPNKEAKKLYDVSDDDSGYGSEDFEEEE